MAGPVDQRTRTVAGSNYINVEPNGRIDTLGQLTYANASVSTTYSTADINSTPSGVGHAHSTVGYSFPQSHMTSVSSSPSPSNHMQGNGRVKQMEQEIHLLRMSVNDKDAQLSQVQRDLSYSHDQIKQLNVLLAEKKESILKYQERISDMQSEIGNLREASLNRQGEPLPDVRAAQQANEALQVQMTQVRAQLADVNQQNTDLRAKNRDLTWQLQQMQKQHPPLRASTSSESSEDVRALRRQSDVMREQHAEAVRENQMLRSRVELLTHQVTTYNEDFKAERSDRERAQTKILEMKEEVSGLHQMIVIMARDHGIQLENYGLGHLPQQIQ